VSTIGEEEKSGAYGKAVKGAPTERAGAERVQKGIAHWDKQNHAVPTPNCVLKIRGEIIKDEGL